MLVPKPLILFLKSKSHPQHKIYDQVNEDNLLASLNDSNESDKDSQ